MQHHHQKQAINAFKTAQLSAYIAHIRHQELSVAGCWLSCEVTSISNCWNGHQTLFSPTSWTSNHWRHPMPFLLWSTSFVLWFIKSYEFASNDRDDRHLNTHMHRSAARGIKLPLRCLRQGWSNSSLQKQCRVHRCPDVTGYPCEAGIFINIFHDCVTFRSSLIEDELIPIKRFTFDEFVEIVVQQSFFSFTFDVFDHQ